MSALAEPVTVSCPHDCGWQDEAEDADEGRYAVRAHLLECETEAERDAARASVRQAAEGAPVRGKVFAVTGDRGRDLNRDTDQDAFDALHTVTSCGLDGCDWTFTGTAAEGREEFISHRGEAHPNVDREQLERRRAEARVAQARGEIASPRRRHPRCWWTPERITAALVLWTERHEGVPPRFSDFAQGHGAGGDYPPGAIVRREFGSWSRALTAAGLEPGRPGPMRTRPEPTEPPLSPVAGALEEIDANETRAEKITRLEREIPRAEAYVVHLKAELLAVLDELRELAE